MANNERNDNITNSQSFGACGFLENSPLKQSKVIQVWYGTMDLAEAAAEEERKNSDTKLLSSLPAKPRNALHSFFLNECLLILSATLAFTVLAFEISVIIGYGDETLRESRYLWALNWFLVAWVGLQFCALTVHHWDCWIKDKQHRSIFQGGDRLV
ncbi:hypothetical protein N431DRAFT_504061 [Stipitochalara longipes BDJ]|nr:hypothetical protein N431DRAFT_504061 [Stipitochalara longipes BDJ]